MAGVICSQGCGDRAIEGAVVAVRKRRGIGDDIGIAIDELAGGGAMVGVEKRQGFPAAGHADWVCGP